MTSKAVGAAPPGPLGELGVTEIRSDPLRWLSTMVDRYGDTVRYRTPGLAATLLNRPADVLHVLQANEHNYTKAGTPDMMMLRPMLGDSLMTSEGSSWDRQRQALQPAFVRHEVEQLGSLMVALARRMVERWRARSDPSAPLDVSDEMTRLTLEIAAHAMFGFDAEETSARFGAAVADLNETMGHVDPGDPVVAARFRAALKTVREVVEGVVARPPAASGGQERAVLAAARHGAAQTEGDTDREVRDQVLTLLLAGHETTAKALTWTMYLLSRHPDWERRVADEVERATGGRTPQVTDLPAMITGWAVLREVMRLYPPIWIISRVARWPDSVGDYEIPAGSLVCMSPFLLHRDRRRWPDPERFRPERFAGESPPGPHDGYIPFSIGPRLCIGRQFAQVELRLVLATLVQACRLELVAGHPVEPEALVTLRPRWGLPMTVSFR